MSDLDDKLREAIMANVSDAGTFDVEGLDPETVDAVIPLIKQVFADEGYVSPENAEKVQEIVNAMANLANDAFQIPTIQYVKVNKAITKAQNLMTGQEWFDQLLLSVDTNRYHPTDPEYAAQQAVLEAARKAAGLES